MQVEKKNRWNETRANGAQVWMLKKISDPAPFDTLFCSRRAGKWDAKREERDRERKREGERGRVGVGE